ncbi:MAG: phosphoribosylaminoimidazolesuccinocarboxamide synthase [Fibrobacterota bacterium]|jgi:phosphoribosylaminoimidazole-succinocarboxamide synthase
MTKALLQSEIGLVPAHRGKVRDVYDLGENLLLVATDRISAFDAVSPTAIPGKGILLTQMSLFWFEHLGYPHHLVATDVKDYPEILKPYADQLEGRSMLVRKAKRFDLECIVRGYIVGSGWKDYKKTSAICGHQLPAGLQECQQLPKTIFTPSTKADAGHDENISVEEAKKIVGPQIAEYLEEASIAIYEKARTHAASVGIILADTKLEFGLIDGKVSLIDEVLTPDSSRFWPADGYAPGKGQPSFDKQYVRDYYESLAWDKNPPAPELPTEIVEKTLEKYREAYCRLTGRKDAPV